jgi:phage FluMu protein Com
MDRVTRCLHCGKRMVPMPGFSGRTELKCVFCDKLDPMEVDAANKGPKARLSLPFPNVP